MSCPSVLAFKVAAGIGTVLRIPLNYPGCVILCKPSTALPVPSATATEYGRMDCAILRMGRYNGTSVESAAIGSARPPSASLTHLIMLRPFIPTGHIDLSAIV